MEKCYNIFFTGKVQDTGFRSLIENIANSYGLHGFIFNDTDDSVKMFCCCENGIINEFLEEVRIKSMMRGDIIEGIHSEENPARPFIPQGFYRLLTDDRVDLGRKLDKGNDVLINIRDRLGSMENTIKIEFGDVKAGINNLNNTLSVFVEEQREHNKRMEGYILEQREHNKRMDEHNKRMDEHNKRMDEHNLRLEKILERLAEK